MGRRARHRRRRPASRGARPAARAGRRGPARPPAQPLRRRGRDRPRRRPPARPRPRPDTSSPIQGPPGSGKTYTGARMICTLLAAGQAGRHHRDEPQGHRQPARGGPKAADEERRRRPAVQHGEPDQVLVRRPSHPRPRTPATSRGQLDDGRGEPRRRDVLAVGVGEDGRRGRRPVRRRGRPDLAGQRRRDVARDARASCCSAIRSSSTSRCRARIRRAPTGRRWPTFSATHATMPPDRGLFLETTWRLHPDLCAFTSEVFYDDRLEPEAHLGVQRWRRGRLDRRRGRAAAPRRARRSAPTTSRPRRRRRSRPRPSLVEGGATWIERARRSAPADLGGRPDRRAVQRPGRRPSSDACRRRPASGRSTSSRARRRRSASTR